MNSASRSKWSRPNPILAQAAEMVGRDRPPVPASLPYTLAVEEEVSGSFARLWFRTRGCRHTYRGGCTMCDYWISTNVARNDMIDSVRMGLKEIPGAPSTLLFETSGSFLDDWEVPAVARMEILRLARELTPGFVMFETRCDTITEEGIRTCAQALAPIPMGVEVGVESMDDWVLRYCINKDMTASDVRGAVDRIRAGGGVPVANVLLGSPLLPPRNRWRMRRGHFAIVSNSVSRAVFFFP